MSSAGSVAGCDVILFFYLVRTIILALHFFMKFCSPFFHSEGLLKRFVFWNFVHFFLAKFCCKIPPFPQFFFLFLHLFIFKFFACNYFVLNFFFKFYFLDVMFLKMLCNIILFHFHQRKLCTRIFAKYMLPTIFIIYIWYIKNCL